jgi:ribose transport system substrate-binding protein
MFIRIIGIYLAGMLLASSAVAQCVGVIPAGAGLFFWDEVIRGATDAARNLDLETYVRAPSEEANAQGQRMIVESAILHGCTSLLLAPNSHDIVGEVSKLSAYGVPTVYIDRDLGGERLGVVKTNDYEAGAFAGKQMVRLLNGAGRVGLFRMDKNVVTTTQREAGFLDAVRSGGLRVVFEEFLGSSIGEARENTLRLMNDHVEVDGVFTPNETTTVGALISLAELRKSNAVKHIGFDFNPLIIGAIREGRLAGVMVQQPYQIGYVGILTLAKSMKDQLSGETIFIESFYVDMSNLNDRNTRELLGTH